MPNEILANITVKEICKMIADSPTLIKRNTKIDDVFEKILEDPRTRHAYVVDDKNILIGSIRLNSIIDYMFPGSSLSDSVDYSPNGMLFKINPFIADDIMKRDPKFVYEDDKLSNIIAIMKKEQINELPVINKEKKVIGEVNFLEIIAGYLKIKKKQSK